MFLKSNQFLAQGIEKMIEKKTLVTLGAVLIFLEQKIIMLTTNMSTRLTIDF